MLWGGNESDIVNAKLDIDVLNKIADELGGDSNAKTVKDALHNIGQVSPRIINKEPMKDPDVRFLDYDGTVIYGYSAEEFIKLTAMPANPTHEGLTAQGWNYTLTDAKNYVTDYGKLDIGQMYITDDGKTRIHIKLEDGRLKPRLGLGINGSAVVDWGDNSQTNTMTGSSLSTTVYQEHEYSAPGEYTISIAVTGGITFLGSQASYSHLLTKTGGNENTNKVYLSSIKSIELGSNVTNIGNDAFDCCYSLASITIPDSVANIGNNAFYSCLSLINITIPNSVMSIGNGVFQNCYSLTGVVIPKDVTSINSSAFRNCYSLTGVTIPNNTTNIGQDAFNNCYSLASITIPDNITTISNSMFSNCYSLASITISDSVISIGSNALVCHGLGFIKFKRLAPATVSNKNAWSSVPTDCIIYVPQGSLSAYTSASNYPSSSTYTYIEY